MKFNRRRSWSRLTALLAMSCLLALVLQTAVVSASAASKRPHGADRARVISAHKLKRCLRRTRPHAKHCRSGRGGLQRAGATLATAGGHLVPSAPTSAGRLVNAATTTAPDAQAAPKLSVSGTSLTWDPVANVSTYQLATSSPGNPVQYSIVSGTSVTPQSVPGVTVRYSVRTAVNGSAWASEVAVRYAADSSSSSPSSTAPLGAPGEPFTRGVAVDPVGWGQGAAPEIAGEVHSLGAEWVRTDLSWKEVMPSPGVYDWSHFDAVIRNSQALGLHVLPILGYAPSWTTPTDAAGYAEFVAAAVARYGPGTSADLRWFEMWNEPYFAYAWSGKTPEPAAYARDVLAAAQAAKKVNPDVKVLVAGEYADGGQTGGSSPYETSWINDMFSAAPDLGKWIDGVAVHPYGDDPVLPLAEHGGFRDATGKWSFQRIDTMREQFLAHGVNVPFWITEVGWSTYNESEGEQAQAYADLIPQVASRPWIRALFAYCLREVEEHPTTTESQTGLLKFGSWQPKPAFYALQQGFKALS